MVLSLKGYFIFLTEHWGGQIWWKGRVLSWQR